MKYSPTQQKAIKYFQEQNNLKLALSTLPKVNFIDKDGNTISRNVRHLETEYKRA